ncbi:uncharacterized protein LOC134461389 isoform X2 [Engraulis encrasicolus]|uniref:uncharacterized protein LOC134461389 isoform X2 n=1 Tax=Engraulis encrasicolus TaxID=184585 RepID=UPI002FD413FD
MYAGRKRRKPVQKAAKPPPVEGVKSNPSKRHRDRLNGELERLASLLPFAEDVTTSLDKLSILRLSVSYLRAKNFFSVALKSHACSNGVTANAGGYGNGKCARLADGWMLEGELLLQALNGFILVLTADGTIFYTSHTIQDYLGFHQTDVMHQSVFEMVHTEDQEELRRNLHWALNPPAVYPTTQDSGTDGSGGGSSLVSSSSSQPCHPEQLPPENSSFLERSFVCRFRCLLDNSSGFMALSLQGRLKFLHGQSHHGLNGAKAPPELALFAIATPLQSPSILEIRTKNMIFRTKHKLDFTPMACDAKGKIVLGYTEAELRVRGSGYQFIHAADMLHCAENHIRMIKTGESGLTVFRLLTKENRWKWVQANARLVYKNGRPDYIIATQRPLLDEEGGEHLRKRSQHMPFTFTTGEALLYHSSHPIPGFADGHPGSGSGGGGGGSSSSGTGEGTHDGKAQNGAPAADKDKHHQTPPDGLDPNSLLGAIMSQDGSVYISQPAAAEPKLSLPAHLLGELKGHHHNHHHHHNNSHHHHHHNQFADSILAAQCSEAFERWDGETGSNGDKVPALISPPHENGKSFDPLLATLDSLTLGSDGVPSVSVSVGEAGGGGRDGGGCSNGELFSALEGLGLSAEDLELLLLDERMIRVELDPEHVPSLDELLTSDEILSYIHESLEHRAEVETEEMGMGMEVGGPSLGALLGGPTPITTTTTTTNTSSLPTLPAPQTTAMATQVPGTCGSQDAGANAQYLDPRPPLGRPPILALSQQMQQNLTLKSAPPTSAGVNSWGQQQQQQQQHNSHPVVVESKDIEQVLQRLPPGSNGYCSRPHMMGNNVGCMGTAQPRPMPGQTFLESHHHQKTSQLGTNGCPPLHYHHFPLPQQQQHPQVNHYPQHQPPCHNGQKDSTVTSTIQSTANSIPFTAKDHWRHFNQSGQGDVLNNTGPCLCDGPALSACPTNSGTNYCVVDVPVTVNGDGMLGGNGIHQNTMDSIAAYHAAVPKGQEQLAQVLSSLSNQILGTGPAYRQLSQLESCGLFTSELMQQAQQAQHKNGCLSSATHPVGSVATNGHGLVVPGDMGLHPETLPSFSDPQTTGFFL